MSSRDRFERLWTRFGPDGALGRGVAAAFALIGCYDGDVSPAEARRYSEFAASLPSGDAYRDNDRASSELREAAFGALTRAILDDFDSGRESTLAVLRSFRGNAQATEVILRAAQSAIVADGVDEIREEVAMREICQSLGVDPQAY